MRLGILERFTSPFPGRPVVGESLCIGKEGFLHSRRDSLCRPQGGFPPSDSPNFWVRGLGGWVSLEEGLPQHAFNRLFLVPFLPDLLENDITRPP